MQENRAVYADTPAAPAQGHATTGRRANPTISVPAAVGERSNFKKIPTHTQDHGDA